MNSIILPEAIGLLIFGVLLVFFFKHLFGMKYPMLDSSKIFLLPALQTLVMTLPATYFYKLFILSSSSYGHYSSGLDSFLVLLGLLSIVVGIATLSVMLIKLLYATFNFNQYKRKYIKDLFQDINNGIMIYFALVMIASFDLIYGVDVTWITISFLLITIVGIVCIVYVKTQSSVYKCAIEELYLNEYSDSIETMIVKRTQAINTKETESPKVEDQSRKETESPKVEDQSHKETKICPYCGKEILSVAKRCRYCREWLDDEEVK